MRGVVATAMALLLVVACSSGPRPTERAPESLREPSVHQSDAARPIDVESDPTIPQTTKTAYAVFASSFGPVQSPLAVKLFRSVWALPNPSAETVEARLLVVNFSDSSIPVRVACAVNGKQRPCADDADTVAMSMQPRSQAIVPMKIRAHNVAVDIMVTKLDDLGRVFSSSSRLRLPVGQVPDDKVTGVLAPHSQVFIGCNVAGVNTTDHRSDDYVPPKIVDASADLYLVIEFCQYRTEKVRFLAVGDGQRILPLPPSVSGTLRPEGRTAVIPLREVIASWPSICTLQFVVVRERPDTHPRQWLSPAVNLCGSVAHS